MKAHQAYRGVAQNWAQLRFCTLYLPKQVLSPTQIQGEGKQTLPLDWRISKSQCNVYGYMEGWRIEVISAISVPRSESIFSWHNLFLFPHLRKRESEIHNILELKGNWMVMLSNLFTYQNGTWRTRRFADSCSHS